jgi:hypothetical protein
MLYYNFKIEKHAGEGFYCGLGATDDPAPDAPAKTYSGWRMYPWNGGVPPTDAQLKADFTARAKDDKGADVAGSSAKDQHDAFFAKAPVVVTDATPMVTVKDKDQKDVLVPVKVTIS